MLPLIAFVCTAIGPCVLGSIRVEKALGAVVGLWMALLTVLGAFGALAWIDMVSACLIALALPFGIGALRRHGFRTLANRFRTQVLTPGFLIFILSAAFLYWATRPMVVWWADDVYYWALEPKALWFLGGFSDAAGSLAPDFATNTPGVQLIQWLFLRFSGTFAEANLYLALYLTVIVYLLPLCEGITWKRWWAIPLMGGALIALPLLADALSYTFLGVDAALAACFAFVLITLEEKRVQPFALAGGLCGLVLIKQTGAFLLLAAAGYLWVRRRAAETQPRLTGEPRPLGRARAALPWLAPALALAFWYLICRASGFTGANEGRTTNALAQILSGTFVWPENWGVFPAAFWHALTHVPTAERLLTGLPVLPLPKIGWIALLVVAPLGLSRVYGRKRMARLSAYALLLSAAYLSGMLLSFATTFAAEIRAYTGEHVNNLSLLMERYLAPLVLGLLALEGKLALDAMADARCSARTKALLACACAAGLALCLNWASLGSTLLPDGYRAREDTVAVTAQTEETAFWMDAMESRSGAVVLVGFSDDSVFLENLSYTYAPARFIRPGADNGDADALTRELQARGVTHLVCLDDANALYQGASALTEDGWLDTYTLYAVRYGEDGVTLQTME